VDPGAYPGIDAGVRGMRFVEAVLKSREAATFGCGVGEAAPPTLNCDTAAAEPCTAMPATQHIVLQRVHRRRRINRPHERQ